ncbi:MAG: hypothetical protein SNJ77_03185 [Cytophagales bacterium]
MKVLNNISFKAPKLKQWVSISIAISFLLSLMAFSGIKQQSKVVKEISVDINTDDEIFFIDENTVLDLATLSERDPLVGRNTHEVDLKEIEARVKSNQFAHEVDAQKDTKGDLHIKVKQCKPIARIIFQNKQHYISDKGTLLPMSEKFTAKVPVLIGQGVYRLSSSDLSKDSLAAPYFELLTKLINDRFFNALIHTIDINLNGDINLYPLVGKQVFLFGEPSEIEDKLLRIKIYYHKIAPSMGWNKYEFVNVKFKNQIIAE